MLAAFGRVQWLRIGVPKQHGLRFKMSHAAANVTHSEPSQYVNRHPESEVLLATNFASVERWAEYLRGHGLRLRVAPVEPNEDLSRVEFAICWSPQPGLLQRCLNLKAIQSMGAGVDSMLGDTTLPRHVPLLRVIDPLMSERMATWVLWGVINVQRRCDAYWGAQQEARWAKDIENFRNIDNSELKVSVLGAGVMGQAVIDVLIKMGYAVSSWTRRPRSIAGAQCFAGQDQLSRCVQAADVVVNLLPLTPHTEGILNADLFGAMPRGAALINAARGRHLVEKDLLAALNSGHLSSAILDVFTQEPLPSDSQLWGHPCVRVFPHVSSMTNIATGVEQMLANRDCVLEGRAAPKELVVDWEAGY